MGGQGNIFQWEVYGCKEQLIVTESTIGCDI